MPNFGILTIAFGSKYLQMAKHLSLSLNNSNKNIKKAIVTNEDGRKRLQGYYDIFIPLKENIQSKLTHKLLLVDYSPFEETLFIDADCLVYKDLNAAYEVLQPQSFSNVGQEITDGEWYMPVKQVLEKMGLEKIPKINGGIYYFKKDETSKAVQHTALKLSKKYFDLGLTAFSDGGINEEPIYALSMALNKISVVSDPQKLTMYTPLDIEGNLTLDILNSKATFIKNGIRVNPSILHFCGSLSQQFHYKREVFCLRLLYRGIPKSVIKYLSLFFFNFPYIVFVFSKRCVKVLIGRKSISFQPILPLYSNL